MKTLLLFAAALTMLFASTNAQSTKPATKHQDFAFAEIVESAKRQLLERYDKNHPGVSEKKFSRPPRVTMFDDHWEVTWIVTAPRATGGGPIVKLERDDLKFISVMFQQ